MPNQINSTNTPKKYDAGDMLDLATLAECDMDWMYTALVDVRLRVARIKEELTARDVNAQYHFHTLEKVLEMYEYIAEDRTRCHEQQAEAYKEELEKIKGGIHD